jgi:hypothetical protein
MKLATKMGGGDADEIVTETTTGAFKRIDKKGLIILCLRIAKVASALLYG